MFIMALPLIACTSVEKGGQAPSAAGFGPRTSQGEVTIELTPRYVDGLLLVEYGLNTHSIDMSEIDLQEQATLIADGREYKPLERPTLSSHHNSGELRFGVPTMSASFEIIVVGVPDVGERRFAWP